MNPCGFTTMSQEEADQATVDSNPANIHIEHTLAAFHQYSCCIMTVKALLTSTLASVH